MARCGRQKTVEMNQDFHISASVLPSRAGDGEPSGGLDGANGVMLYAAHGATGSWLDTCTLPPADVALCTAALNTFVGWYGGQ